MAEYIDRQALLDEMAELKKSPWYNDENFRFIRKEAVEIVEELCVKRAPSAAVRENVRGEWLHVVETIYESKFYGHRCSKCNYWKAMGTMNFCPNCGAEMRTTCDGDREREVEL